MRLKKRALASGIPTLYVNDDYGDWRSEKEALRGRFLEAKGADFVRPLLPDSEDYFVLWPMHSTFYMTPLEVRLQQLQVETLNLTGLTSNSCITVSAHDENMRGFDLYDPTDCSRARSVDEHRQALAQLEATAGASTMRSNALRPPKLLERARLRKKSVLA